MQTFDTNGSKVVTEFKDCNLVFVFRFSLKEDNKKGGKNTFTCIACHPKDDCIATGHEDGKIRLW